MTRIVIPPHVAAAMDRLQLPNQDDMVPVAGPVKGEWWVDRITALREFEASIVDGNWPWHISPANTGISGENVREMYHAHSGSLDAAKALHDAVLPGWEWRLRDDGQAWVWRTAADLHAAYDETETPARAWLLAIIRALIWQEENRHE